MIKSHTYDEEYEVELKKDSSGLGIEIAGVEHQGMQGIVISSIVRGGPADKTKKMRVGDQVLKVDGKDVRDLESKVAAAAIRNSGEKVKLALGRMQSPRAEWAQISNTSLQQPTQRNTFNIDEFTDQDIERIKSKWKQRLGGGTLMEIKVVTITKASADGGLGVRLDGIQERDDNDVPQGYIHHVIHTVKPDGPVRQQGGLEVGDELLEVNGTSLIDLSHEKAVQVIKNSPSKILIVAAPYQPTSNSPSPNTLREMITKGRDMLFLY
jgi:multiple PDZ domain protein